VIVDTTDQRAPFAGATRDQCIDFLTTEADYLDNRRYADWLALLTEDLVYEMPVRVTRGPDGRDEEFSSVGFHMKDSYGSMKMRVSRLCTEHAFAEDPPSRTLRFVTNVRVAPTELEIAVRSNFLCYRSQGDSTEFDLLAGQRHDLLRETPDGLRLARRKVLLAHTTLVTANLGIFM